MRRINSGFFKIAVAAHFPGRHTSLLFREKTTRSTSTYDLVRYFVSYKNIIYCNYITFLKNLQTFKIWQNSGKNTASGRTASCGAWSEAAMYETRLGHSLLSQLTTIIYFPNVSLKNSFIACQDLTSAFFS